MRNPDHGSAIRRASPNGSRTEMRRRPVPRGMKRITGSLVVCVGAGLFTAGALLFDSRRPRRRHRPPRRSVRQRPPTAARDAQIDNFKFASITVKPGAVVSIANRDDATHTVTADKGAFNAKANGKSTASLRAPAAAGHLHVLLCDPSRDARHAHRQVSGITSSRRYRRAPAARRRLIVVGLFLGDRERREVRQRDTGPQRDVIAVVERADRDQVAGRVSQPRLVEEAAVATRQPGGIQLDAQAGLLGEDPRACRCAAGTSSVGCSASIDAVVVVLTNDARRRRRRSPPPRPRPRRPRRCDPTSARGRRRSDDLGRRPGLRSPAAASAAMADTMRSSRSGSGSTHIDGSASSARNSSSSACALVVEIAGRITGQIADPLVVAAHWCTSIIGTSRRFIRFPIRYFLEDDRGAPPAGDARETTAT